MVFSFFCSACFSTYNKVTLAPNSVARRAAYLKDILEWTEQSVGTRIVFNCSINNSLARLFYVPEENNCWKSLQMNANHNIH
jgi:hypothetical protein